MITLKLDVLVDDAVLATAGKQVPFAISKAMNSSMVKAQARQISRMRVIFTIRRATFLNLSVKITQFARKDRLVAELAIAPPGGRADIFGKFELGEIKRPRTGRSLAIPVTGSPVKRNRTTIITARNRPRALLDAANAGPGRGAFLRPAEGDRPGAIFIRRGRHIVLAYTLEPDAPIQPDLKFEDTVVREFTRDFPIDFDIEWAKAVRTAK